MPQSESGACSVGICYHLLPGLALFFAARVTERFDEQSGDHWRTGFTYVTLVGHPELGRETFCVEKDLASGRIVVTLRSWSKPGTRLAQALAPLVMNSVLRGIATESSLETKASDPIGAEC